MNVHSSPSPHLSTKSCFFYTLLFSLLRIEIPIYNLLLCLTDSVTGVLVVGLHSTLQVLILTGDGKCLRGMSNHVFLYDGAYVDF